MDFKCTISKRVKKTLQRMARKKELAEQKKELMAKMKQSTFWHPNKQQ